MKKSIILILSLLIILTGCSSKKDDTNKSNEMLSVSIKAPDKVKVNEEIKIEAHVTQGNEKVDDANEVKFEIWKSGQDTHEMLDGKHEGKGIYSATKTFTEDGIYFIVSHVTARDLHNMPKKKIIVDSSNKSSEISTNKTNQDHAHSNVTIELEKNEKVITNKETNLSATIQNDDAPLTDANVKFEVWKENEEKHQYIDAVEENNGKYIASYTFLIQGTYLVIVHVNKGEEIHEHIQETIDVK